MNVWDFEAIDWDDDDDEDGNLLHCLRRGIDERIVSQVLSEAPVEIKMRLASAEIALVGPDSGARCGLFFLTGRTREETGSGQSRDGLLSLKKSTSGSEREEQVDE